MATIEECGGVQRHQDAIVLLARDVLDEFPRHETWVGGVKLARDVVAHDGDAQDKGKGEDGEA